MLHVQLLGRFAVERDGAAVALPVAGARLLSYLALRPGPHERDALAARFWPDAPASAGRASLRSAVWALRKAVGEDAVIASRSTIGLAVDGLSVDVAEVGALAAAGDLAGAVALCRGEVLPELDDEWVDEARAAQRSLHAELLDRLIVAAESRSDLPAAVRWSRLRCALDPLDEPAHAELVRLLGVAGDRAGGVAAGRAFVQRLDTALGLAPGPGMRAALAAVSGGAAGRRAEVGSGRRSPMFGRSGELTTLMAAWASTRDGHGRVVLITGEGGIGKTRLVSELARRVAGVGARVAVGAGVDVGGEAPLAVWQELATELVAAVPEPPSGAAWPAELGRLGPDLAAALGAGGAPPPVAAPELERLRIFDAVLRLIEWAAGDRPVLLVAEDVHRADRASLALCTHIGRRLTGLPVLFLLTRRDRPTRPETDALLTDLAGRGVDVEEIELGPLTEAELGAVTRSVAALAEDDVHRVVAAAEGNPLLAVERARALAAGSTALPSSLRAAVRAAIGPLSRPARELADALAAAGRALSAPEIDALALPDRVDAERQVLESGLVRRDGGGMHFRHALLAEAARGDLVDPQRNHEQVGLAIEKAAAASGDRVAAEVARHLQQAGRPDLAGPRWRRAAAHARSLGALPEAAAFWREAAACAPHDPEPWLQLAEVHGWLGRREDFEQAWSDAIVVVPEPDRWAAWCRRGNILSAVLCHPSAALAAFRTAWELLPAGAPAAVRADVLAKLAQVATSAEPHVAAALLDQVAELDPTPRSDVHAARLLLLVQQGRFEDLEEAAAEVGAANEQANRPDEWWAGLLTAASGLAAGGRMDAALRVTDRALQLARGVPVLALPCLAARAHLLSRLSRHEEAMAAAHEQLVMAERLDSPAFAALASNDAGLIALAAGHHAEAAALLGAALDGRARISRPASRLARAEALARSGEPDEATAELRRAALEPVGAADQPWALVPRMARVQGLVALARGEAAQARLRFGEAATGWRRRRRPAVGGELMASLVDLGRPPVVGLVEPDRELARLQTELDAIAEEAPGCLASP